MAENDGIRLFGFEIKRTKTASDTKQLPSIVPPVDDDGAGYITASGSHYGQYLNLDGDESKDNSNLNFDSGITYLLDNKKQLDLSIGKGINNDIFFISGGISINID